MGRWVNKIDYHEHDYPAVYRIPVGGKPVAVESTWECACGRLFEIRRADLATNEDGTTYQELEWGAVF